MAGLALALMEVLSDYGTVQFFAVETFTTGIFRTWFGLGERIAASQLSVCLMLLMLVLVLLERRARGRARVTQISSRQQSLPTYALHGWRQVGAIVACATPIVLGLLVPAAVLLQLLLSSSGGAALPSEGESDFPVTSQVSFWALASHSLGLASLTAVLAVVLALILAYGLRLFPTVLMRLATQMTALGYAVPGAVIAVGTLVPLGQLDRLIDHWSKTTFGFPTGLLLSGTIVALVFAYLVRFMAVSLNSVEASLSQIKPSLDEAARSLGHGPTSTLLRIHTPLMSRGLLTAAVLVFVDVMKELPATLIVRPPNLETLATYVYYRAADEQLAIAAAPALMIVGVGLLPVLILSWQIRSARRRVNANRPAPSA
jgi:iron(III) transport system permease protein